MPAPCAARLTAVLLVLLALVLPARAMPDEATLTRGFLATVFGVEHGGGAGILKKFHGPVRVAVIDHAASGRAGDVAAFVRRIDRGIPGLDIAVTRGKSANFTVHLVTRSDYAAVATSPAVGARGRPPGLCMVKVDYGRDGIRRAAAVIVVDEGEALFRRCLVEEILQGLGPMNDDRRLSASVFNDRSAHTALTDHDRAIVALLYDGRLRHGMSARTVRPMLAELIADLRGRMP